MKTVEEHWQEIEPDVLRDFPRAFDILKYFFNLGGTAAISALTSGLTHDNFLERIEAVASELREAKKKRGPHDDFIRRN